jgi:hypothetical protein
MWGPPQRGNHKEAEGEWGKGVTKLDGGNWRKKDKGKGGRKAEGQGEHGTLDAGTVYTGKKTIENGGREWRRKEGENRR